MSDDNNWLSERELQAWMGYRRMRTLLDLHIGRDLFHTSGLSEADYDVLSTLSEGNRPFWRAQDLAARLLWSSSRLAHQARRMSERGLLRREQDPKDRRGALLSLSVQGWDAIRSAAPGHVSSVRRNFIDLLSDEEIDTLHRIATRVVERLDGTDHRTAEPLVLDEVVDDVSGRAPAGHQPVDQPVDHDGA